MDQETLERLAQAHAKIIANYTDCEKAEAAQMAARILQLVLGDHQIPAKGIPDGLERIERVSQQHSQPQENYSPGEGTVLSPKGYRCYCYLCKGDIYELTADLRAKGMGINAFLSAFKPLGAAPELDRDMLNVIKDKQNRTMIDCPVCKGEKSLTIVGQPDRQGQVHAVSPEVCSVDADELAVGKGDTGVE